MTKENIILLTALEQFVYSHVVSAETVNRPTGTDN